MSVSHLGRRYYSGRVREDPQEILCIWENPRINDFIMVHAADVGNVLKRDDVCTSAYRGQATFATARRPSVSAGQRTMGPVEHG